MCSGKLEGGCSHIYVFIPYSDIASEIHDLKAVTRMGLMEEDMSLKLLFLQEEEYFLVPYLISSNLIGIGHNVRKNKAKVKKGCLSGK